MMLALSVHTFIGLLLVSVVDADQRMIRREARSSEDTKDTEDTKQSLLAHATKCSWHRALGTFQEANHDFYYGTRKVPGKKDLQCENPCHHVVQLDMCREARTHLLKGEDIKAKLEEIDTDEQAVQPWPKFCFFDDSAKKVKYNPTEPEPAQYRGKPVCVRELYPVANARGQCLDGFEKILKRDDCRKVTQHTKRPQFPDFEIEKKNAYVEYPYGCFVHDHDDHDFVGFNEQKPEERVLVGKSLCKKKGVAVPEPKSA